MQRGRPQAQSCLPGPGAAGWGAPELGWLMPHLHRLCTGSKWGPWGETPATETRQEAGQGTEDTWTDRPSTRKQLVGRGRSGGGARAARRAHVAPGGGHRLGGVGSEWPGTVPNRTEPHHTSLHQILIDCTAQHSANTAGGGLTARSAFLPGFRTFQGTVAGWERAERGPGKGQHGGSNSDNS